MSQVKVFVTDGQTDEMDGRTDRQTDGQTDE